MDDFSVYGDTFDLHLENLTKVLRRCKEVNLLSNWKKCHFMVQEGVVSGHVICNRVIKVDKAIIEVIERLPPPNSVKGVRSFLGHTGFYLLPSYNQLIGIFPLRSCMMQATMHWGSIGTKNPL